MVWFGGTAGVNISNCNGLHVSGLSINYDNPPHGRLGVLVAVGDLYCTYSPPTHFHHLSSRCFNREGGDVSKLSPESPRMARYRPSPTTS